MERAPPLTPPPRPAEKEKRAPPCSPSACWYGASAENVASLGEENAQRWRAPSRRVHIAVYNKRGVPICPRQPFEEQIEIPLVPLVPIAVAMVVVVS